ncbi:MAG: DNA-processing protein DprA [Gammaproteobacteria bacterium]|nr:DNA-processing protein DprA [Gammaproteobacteria bacterium]
MKLDVQSQAVLLLTASLGKSDDADAKPLTVTEWAGLADRLIENSLKPADLMASDYATKLAQIANPDIDVARLEALLSRGAALGFALARWEGAGLWVMTRSDGHYPKRLKNRLGKKCPPVLFGCGNKGLLNRGGLAVVGSRDAKEVDLEYSYIIGTYAANSQYPIVSGGARGIDDAAMAGALKSNGTAVGVMADRLLAATASKKYRRHLLANNLVLISPFNPEAGFHRGNAMSRNKYIYCLADAAVVVTSTPGTGGTWNGATENLKRRWVPLHVKSTKDEESGNPELIKMGAWQMAEDPQQVSLVVINASPGNQTNTKATATESLILDGVVGKVAKNKSPTNDKSATDESATKPKTDPTQTSAGTGDGSDKGKDLVDDKDAKAKSSPKSTDGLTVASTQAAADDKGKDSADDKKAKGESEPTTTDGQTEASVKDSAHSKGKDSADDKKKQAESAPTATVSPTKASAKGATDKNNGSADKKTTPKPQYVAIESLLQESEADAADSGKNAVTNEPDLYAFLRELKELENRMTKNKELDKGLGIAKIAKEMSLRQGAVKKLLDKAQDKKLITKKNKPTRYLQSES